MNQDQGLFDAVLGVLIFAFVILMLLFCGIGLGVALWMLAS